MNKRLNLTIQGMSCASCVNRIETGLKKEAGIIDASVNLATEKARLEYNDQELTPKKIVKMIKGLGYEASEVNEIKSNKEIKSAPQKWYVLVSAMLTIPLVLPMMLGKWGHGFMLNPWLQLALATPVQFIFGLPFYHSAWSALKHRTGNMDLLVAIGTSSAFGLSLYELNRQSDHLYFESSTVVITLVLLGKFLEAKAKKQTSEAIRSLQNLRPQKAIVKNGDQYIEKPVEEVKLYDVVMVKPGETIPVDGEIVEGETQVNESLVTGESLPVSKKQGDRVVTASLNGEAPILVRVTALGSETMLAKIIRLVEDAQAEKAPIQRLVDKLSSFFVPSVLFIALLTLLLTGLFTTNWEHAILNAVAVLVIACPCALGLATPTSIMVGTGIAARSGILIRDAEALEATQAVRTIIFDKTGTLTEGKPSVTTLFTSKIGHDEFLSLVASIQTGSSHPLAKAVVEEAEKRKISFRPAIAMKTIPGKGIEARLNEKNYVITNKAILKNYNCQEINEAIICEKKGESISYLIDTDLKEIVGFIGFKDNLKRNSEQTIRTLKALGIRTMMITGDNQGSADRVALELGIDDVTAEVLPEQKAKIIEEHQLKGEIVAMVGDGINDAPALALSDVGIAMANGTDVAMNSASITLMRGDPLLIADAILISKKTYKKIQQNLFWAFIYNVIGIPLAAIGYLNPMIAGLAMAMSSICVVMNSLLLRRWKPQKNEGT